MMHTPNRLGGFTHTFTGIRLAWREANFRFHSVAALVALTLSWFLHISTTELLFIMLAIGIVLTAEVFNSALEEFCDHVTPEQHVNIGKIKDLAAGAVFLSSCTALVIGCIVFLPYLIAYL